MIFLPRDEFSPWFNPVCRLIGHTKRVGKGRGAEVHEEVEVNELDGLWGWLLLFTGFVILKMVRIGFLILATFLPLFRDGTWQALTSPGSPAYHPLWERVLIFELAGHIVIGAMAMVALALLVVRSSYAPKFSIGLVTASFAVAAANYFIAAQIPSIPDQGTGYENLAVLVRATIAMLIWVPYFLVSRRVRATFYSPRLLDEPSP
ncbi:DUF2569 family protein [Pseudoxanthomonas sp. CF125]|uniref:DUF2569 family protein n=1 Tax=Pseudoxanthomonas sp. CF125 TaxID=1855303 RepID=UPI0008876BB4|nr:DUF2569 family protein [Pseudoxanthomonas sp. CF125]SDQ85425.1 Protein of unknown function [Pseudoxanthomonas sp. CF125]